MQLIHHRIDVPGLRLHALEWGDRDAPPLVLLHGGRDHARAWDATAVHLARQWRVVAPDLRGHGDSDWSAGGHYSRQDMVSDLLAVTRALDIGRAPLIGHSLGANIVLHYAAAFPERVDRLVAIEGIMRSPEAEAARYGADPAKRLRSAVERGLAPARARRRYPDFDAATARLAEATGIRNPVLLRHLAETGMDHNADGSISWKYDPRIGPGPITDGALAELADILRAITCPTLLVYGEDSPASRPSRDGRLDCVRDAREAVIPAAGHWVQHDAPGPFLAALDRFLDPAEP